MSKAWAGFFRGLRQARITLHPETLILLDRMQEEDQTPPIMRYWLEDEHGHVHAGGDSPNMRAARKGAKLYQSLGAARTAQQRCRTILTWKRDTTLPPNKWGQYPHVSVNLPGVDLRIMACPLIGYEVQDG